MIGKKIISVLFGCAVMCPVLLSAEPVSEQVDELYQQVVQRQPEALDKLKALGKQNEPQALAVLGFIYEYGISEATNIPQALQYYQQACEQGGNFGCYNAWYFYHYGQGVAQDSSLGQQFSRKMNLADISTKQDILTEVTTNIYAIKADVIAGDLPRYRLIEAVTRYLNSSNDETKLFFSRIGFSRKELLRLTTFWAKDGDAELNFLVGHLYNFGYAEIKNENIEALKWFRIAAEAGQAEAQNLLGIVYREGRWGVKADGNEAIKWYRRAAEQNDKDALMNLAEIYYEGEITRVDYAQALSLFERAYQRGNSRAARYLGWMYNNGQHVDVDCERAFQYFERSYSLPADDKQTYLAACTEDKQRRKQAAKTLPVVSVKHNGMFIGGRNDVYRCELKMVVSTNKLGEIANLRVNVVLENDDGLQLAQVLAFPAFGLNTFNIDSNNRESNSFEETILLPIYQSEFCQHDLTWQINAATATVNGQEMDLLKTGVLTPVIN